MAISAQTFKLSTAILALTATGALAQDASDGDPFDLGTLVLRGELQDRTLQESATSAAVVTGEQLEQRSEPNVYDVIERTPNVTVSGGNTGFAIRGIDQRSVGGGGSSVISIQVDGVALPSTQSTFFGPYSTWDLEQIEVLRGPQSTQQGRNALAGAIIVRSKDPTYDPEYKFRLGLASRDTLETAVALNTPLVDDRLAFRFSAETFQTDGWLANPTLGTDDFDAQEATTVRAKLRWDPLDTLNIVASYTYAENYGSWAEAEDQFFPEDRVNFSDSDFRHGSDHQIFGIRANWSINSVWSLESETTYYDQDYLRNADNDFSAEPLGTFRRRGGSDAFEQDLRLRFETDTLRGVVGLFYSDTESDSPTLSTTDASFFNDQLTAFGLPGFEIGEGFLFQDRNFGNSSENIALFGEVDIDVPQVAGLTFTLGARYDTETIKLRRLENYTLDDDAYLARLGMTLPPETVALVEAGLAAQVPPDIPATESSRDFDAFLPKLSVNYEWTSDVSTAFTVQRAYRAGGANVNLATGEEFEFDPEYAWNYEIAFRGQFLDGRLTTNANLFFLDWTDQQVSVQGSDPLDSITVNAGESEVYGFELSVDANISPNFDIFAAVGYAQSEFTNFVVDGVDFSGNSFGQPEWTGAIGGAYNFGNGFILSADASYTGEAFNDFRNVADEKIDDRFLVNVQLSYETPQGLRAAIYANNLLDEEYTTNLRNLPDGRRMVSTGAPRTIGAYIQMEF